MANVLTYSWLKFIDKSSFTTCVVICVQTSNIDTSNPGCSSPVSVVKI
jgi:hypothetical protein